MGRKIRDLFGFRTGIFAPVQSKLRGIDGELLFNGANLDGTNRLPPPPPIIILTLLQVSSVSMCEMLSVLSDRQSSLRLDIVVTTLHPPSILSSSYLSDALQQCPCLSLQGRFCGPTFRRGCVLGILSPSPGVIPIDPAYSA